MQKQLSPVQQGDRYSSAKKNFKTSKYEALTFVLYDTILIKHILNNEDYYFTPYVLYCFCYNYTCVPMRHLILITTLANEPNPLTGNFCKKNLFVWYPSKICSQTLPHAVKINPY